MVSRVLQWYMKETMEQSNKRRKTQKSKDSNHTATFSSNKTASHRPTVLKLNFTDSKTTTYLLLRVKPIYERE